MRAKARNGAVERKGSRHAGAAISAEHAASIAPARAPGGQAAVLGLQRSAGNRAVQRVLAHPMPEMTWQVGKPGVLGVVDLNCGWYCEKALLAHWFEKLSGRPPEDLPLPNPKLAAYAPERHHTPALQQAWYRLPCPDSAGGWEELIEANGPMIVSGKLGAADWGRVLGLKRGWKLGVGHYILMVGADEEAGTVSYLDPLQGDRLRTASFDHVAKRLDSHAYFLNQTGAIKMLKAINAR